MDIHDQVVWITGTSRGIGRALAVGFAQRGATVVATCRGEGQVATDLQDELRQCSQFSQQSIVLRQDVSKEEDAHAVAQVIQKKFGKLDTLINNAGIDPRQSADGMSYAQWREVLDINLDGAWHSAQAAIPFMKKQSYGNIIQAGSITTTLGMANVSHYQASKMGLLGMTRGMARDLGPYGIRVNCVVLGAIATESERDIGTEEDVLRLVNKTQCIEGRIRPEDVEPTFAFLASAASDAITGQSITVDLGWTHTV